MIHNTITKRIFELLEALDRTIEEIELERNLNPKWLKDLSEAPKTIKLINWNLIDTGRH